MTEQTERQVNIPLLRKAVEWAEAEATKPRDLCEWEQNHYILTPEDRKAITVQDPHTGQRVKKAPECGTCYCIAGYAASVVGLDPGPEGGRKALGLSANGADTLFNYANTIEDVRRIAEELAGERL